MARSARIRFVAGPGRLAIPVEVNANSERLPGMTELSTIVISSSEHDILNKSSGSLCPATKAKVVGLDGKEITKYDTPGELWIQSPSAALGYLNNQKATAETFVHDDGGRWVKTGDGKCCEPQSCGRPALVCLLCGRLPDSILGALQIFKMLT